ncbi:hypothetical protein [Microbacterium sp. KNMS]
MRFRSALVSALLIASSVGLAGCGNDQAEVDACIEKLEQTLAEAGADRDLRQDEIDSCNDPEQREFIMGEN